MGWKNRMRRALRHHRHEQKQEAMVITRNKDREEMVNMPGVGIVPASTQVQPVGYSYPTYQACKHKGDPIKVGPYTILAGGMRDLTATDLEKAHIIVPLTQDIPYMNFASNYYIIAAPLVDYGGVPENWKEFLEGRIIPMLKQDYTLLAYCVGSHGRTGTFLASLISLLEPETEDPIAAVRERHCKKCVESLKQAEAIYALRGQELPEKYKEEFTPKFAGKGGDWKNWSYSAAYYQYDDVRWKGGNW